MNIFLLKLDPKNIDRYYLNLRNAEILREERKRFGEIASSFANMDVPQLSYLDNLMLNNAMYDLEKEYKVIDDELREVHKSSREISIMLNINESDEALLKFIAKRNRLSEKLIRTASEEIYSIEVPIFERKIGEDIIPTNYNGHRIVQNITDGIDVRDVVKPKVRIFGESLIPYSYDYGSMVEYNEEIEKKLSKLSKNTFISKIFNSRSQEIEITKLNIEKEKIKEEIDKLFTSTFYNNSKLQTTFILKKLELLDKEKNNDSYKEKENIFKDFYKKYKEIKEKLSILDISIQYTDEKIKEFSPFIQEQKKKLKEINRKITIEKDFISPGVTSNNYIDTTVENIREQVKNSKNKEETLEDIIIKNNKMYSELKAIENKILSFEKILKDEKKIEEISIKKNLQPEKIMAGYQKSLEKNKENIFNMAEEFKTERRKIQSSLATKNIFEKNKIYETILQTLENSRKRLFSELDNLKSRNEKTNIIFDKIKNNSWEIENFKKLFNKNIEKDKLKEDINPGKIKMEKVLDNTDVKISENIVSKEEKEISSEIKTVNSSKKSINNNDKKIRGNYISIIPKKKKKNSLVDEDDLNIKEYGDD